MALIAFFHFFFLWRIIMIILWFFFFVCFSEDGAVHICFCISRTGIIFHIYVMFHDVIILTFIHSCICLRISSHQIKIPSNEWMSKWLNWSNYSLTFKYSLWTHNIFYAYLQKKCCMGWWWWYTLFWEIFYWVRSQMCFRCHAFESF